MMILYHEVSFDYNTNLDPFQTLRYYLFYAFFIFMLTHLNRNTAYMCSSDFNKFNTLIVPTQYLHLSEVVEP